MIVQTIKKYLKCTECNIKQSIIRKVSKNKKAGHIKKLWCPSCHKRTKHVELDEFKMNRKEPE